MPVVFDPSVRRVFRGAGLAVWAMVAVPLLFQRGLDPVRLGGWALAMAVFAGTFWVSAGAPAHGPRAALLAVQTASVVAIVLLLCDGFEGALLVLVALQWGAVLGWRAGFAAVSLQTALLGIAIAIHWSRTPALLLVPPYLGFQLLAFAVSRLLEQKERANLELRAARSLAADNVRLAERLRIARELHDSVGHRLTALRLHLEAAARLADGKARESCETAQTLAGEALGDVREVVASLREPERIDLVTALKAMAADIPAPRVHLKTPDGLVCGDAARALTLLRCAQELMTNAARHARAANLWIELVQSDGAIQLSAKDDGAGAATVEAGAGLRGMRERFESAGGRVEIATARGAGFAVRAWLPTGSQ